MTAKEAREIVEEGKTAMRPLPLEFAKGFLEGHAAATKAAEPLLILINEQLRSLRQLVTPPVQPQSAHDILLNLMERRLAEEVIASSKQVVETYKKETLGE